MMKENRFFAVKKEKRNLTNIFNVFKAAAMTILVNYTTKN